MSADEPSKSGETTPPSPPRGTAKKASGKTHTKRPSLRHLKTGWSSADLVADSSAPHHDSRVAGMASADSVLALQPRWARVHDAGDDRWLASESVYGFEADKVYSSDYLRANLIQQIVKYHLVFGKDLTDSTQFILEATGLHGHDPEQPYVMITSPELESARASELQHDSPPHGQHIDTHAVAGLNNEGRLIFVINGDAWYLSTGQERGGGVGYGSAMFRT